MKKNSPYIFATVTNQNGDTVESMGSHKSKRIFHFIQREDFSNCLFEVSVRYSKDFKNETNPQTLEKTLLALRAFLEK